MTHAIRFQSVSIAFGAAPQAALARADAGESRAEIQTATGQVLGVHDCTLDVAAGEILVLMGLSGSGKSTLLRAVNALAPVARGHVEVRVGDRMVNVTQARGAALRHLRQTQVAMVFQQFGLLPWRSVRDNVGFGLELAGLPPAEARARVDLQLARVGLSDRAGAQVAELSGGMQQRVGLARALATEAPILLMDEPFSALDPLIRTKLQDDLLALQRDLRRTILFVSHDLDEAFRIGNRIAIMDGGRIVQCGTPREIMARPATDHVAEFVKNINLLAVFTARDVMQPGPGWGQRILPATPLREILARFAVSPAPLAVAEGEGGAVIGTVTPESVAARLGGGAPAAVPLRKTPEARSARAPG